MVFFWKKTKERVMRKRKKLLFAVLTCLMIFACGAITVFAADGGKEYVPKMYSSFWALVPPIVAIGLALITKEVYSSLFVGIAIGGIFWSNFHFEKAVLHIFEDGIVGVLTDIIWESWYSWLFLELWSA